MLCCIERLYYLCCVAGSVCITCFVLQGVFVSRVLLQGVFALLGGGVVVGLAVWCLEVLVKPCKEH